MEEELLPYKGDFHKECDVIDFFVKTLNEIKTQIEFYGYICEKDYKIFSYKAEKGLKKLEILKQKITIYKDEPSNLYLIENELLKGLHIYYSTYKKLYPECFKSIKSSIKPICQNLENVKKNILSHSISMLKLSLRNNNNKELIKYLKETIELVMINSFKGLFNLHQLILIYSKQKNSMYLTIKNSIEQKKENLEELNIVINDVTERDYAQKYKVNYEPIHFGNNMYKNLLSNEIKDVIELSNSFLNYTMVFIHSIQIRKKIIKELRIFADDIRKKNENIIPSIKKICEKITSKTKKLTHSSPGTINSWNLVFSSWNSVYSSTTAFLKFEQEVCSKQLTKNIDESNEEYKSFQKKWEKYAEKIKELRNKYKKCNIKKEKKEENKEKTEEENKEKKMREDKLRNYLMIDCTDFLDSNIPALRDNELKGMNEVKNLKDKLQLTFKNNFNEYLENTENEYDNAASIELFDEIQNMFESQLELLDIKDMENYMDSLKEKISKIDFDDNLAANARISLAEYYEHNDFEEDSDLSGGEMENPFGQKIIKENDIESNNLDDDNLFYGKIGTLKDDELSSINNDKLLNRISDKDLKEINDNIICDKNYKTPSFHGNSETKNLDSANNEQNKNNEYEANSNDLKVVNNLDNQFNAEKSKKINDDINNNQIENKLIKKQIRRISIHDSKKRIDNLSGNTLCCLRGGNIDINNEIDDNSAEYNNKIDEVNEINSDDSFLSLNDDNKNISIKNENLSPIINHNEKNQKDISSLNLNKSEINKGIKEKDKNFELKKNNIQNITSINNDLNQNKNNISHDNQTLHYGILGILGLFCLKSLFSSSIIFSADNFLNIVILGLIGFITYKSQLRQ